MPSPRRTILPKGFWEDKANHKLFLNNVAKDLGIKSFEDWYDKSYQDVVSKGGRVLLNNYYKNSLVRALESVYPEYSWQRWKFKNVGLPRGFWDNENNVVAYLKYLAEHFSITNQQDWSLLTKDYVERSGGRPLLKKYGGLSELLQRFVPGFLPTSRSASFQKSLSRSVSKGQGRLLKVITSLFPEEQVLCDYKHPKLLNQSTYMHLELDIFVPKYNLAFEYQGEQHYSWHYLYGSNVSRQLRDAEKRKLCQENNITMIEIPFWWNRERESIHATIHKYRPDIVPFSSGTPVDLEGAPSSIQKLQELSKTLTTSPVIPEISLWNSRKSPIGWWMVQVPSGIHCLWNGKQLILQSGSTLEITTPKGTLLLYQTLPSFPVEGILYSNSQEDVTSFQVPKFPIQIQHPEKLRFFAVDLPPLDSAQIDGYETRINKLTTLTISHSPLPELLELPKPEQCETTHQFNTLKATAEETKHHIWLFRPRSLYLQRPSTTFYVQSSLHHNTNLMRSEHLPQARSYAPYVAMEGSSIGAVPKCRGCGKRFTDRKEIRIEARGMFIPGDNVPYRTKYSFCVSLQCVQKGLNGLERSPAVKLPSFEGKVGVVEELKNRLSDVDGIEWTVL